MLGWVQLRLLLHKISSCLLIYGTLNSHPWCWSAQGYPIACVRFPLFREQPSVVPMKPCCCHGLTGASVLGLIVRPGKCFLRPLNNRGNASNGPLDVA